ncbi:hypothetical protein [Vampirovibrio sp.]|uniref:hypothetical protein n=1 Tax=Vampirovibrio sp. TaxID=2717857 RepID=UPI003592ECE0
MSRFCLSRKLVLVMSVCALFSGGFGALAPAVSYADASWLEMLKPLVKDVIVPGASAGMKRLIEKKMNLKLNPSSTADSSFENMGFMSADNSMSMPEEPTSDNSGTDDSILSMPEEPTYSATSRAESLSPETGFAPPPPPMETP